MEWPPGLPSRGQGLWVAGGEAAKAVIFVTLVRGVEGGSHASSGCTDRKAPQGLHVSLVGDLERQLYLSVARAVIPGGAHTAGAPISPAGQEDQEAPTPLT